jgi:F420 biosynthesis protein FbiB-like protein
MSQAFDDILRERMSVRSFTDAPVDPAVVRHAIEMAGWAPSPHGTQPWRFAGLESQDSRTALAEAMAADWKRQLSLDGDPPAEIARRAANSRERLTTAPIVVVLSLDLSRSHLYPDTARQDAERLMAVQSLGAAAQNFLLSVHEQGLAAGWMCAPLFAPEVVRTAIGLPEHLIPHALFPVGHMKQPPKRRPRLLADDLIAAWL